MSNKQSSSDPLPYVQIDRAAEPTFALLAGKLKVTHQHAIGSLYEFWKLCGAPRELEAVVAATPPDAEPELVLPADVVVRRFEIASGCVVDPLVLVDLQILEQRAEGFRVRGMSRSFEPIVKRVRARAVAALGGKASAESRKNATGSAQPVGGKGSKPRSDASSDEGVPEPNRQPKRNRTDNRSGTEPTTEAEPNPSGQRSAVSGLTSSSYEDDGPASPPSHGVQFFDWFQTRRAKAGWAREKAPPREDLDGFFASASEQLQDTPEGTRVGLEVATDGYHQDPHWLVCSLPWSGFIAQWARHVRSDKLRQASMPLLSVLEGVG